MRPAAQRVWSWVRRVAPWVLATLVLALVARLARMVDWPEVWAGLRTLSPTRLVGASALALFSYALYASFDLVGRRLTGHTLSIPRTMGIAAISYAFGLNFGSWIGGIGLRLRLYTRWGLPASTAARIIAHSVVTNWIGYLWVAGAVLMWAPPALPPAWMLPDIGLRAIGLAMVAAVLAYLALCRYSRQRQLRWRGYVLLLARGRLAAVQALAGGANWLLIGTVTWSLLGGRIDYPTVLGAMLLAAVAGVVTHVPANLGVTETVVVATLGARLPVAELLAALLAYRATYYLLPLSLALPAYALSESTARRVGVTSASASASASGPGPGHP